MARPKAENATDWGPIQREHRLGQKSNNQIAREFSIQASSLSRRAKKEGWVQDKSKEVRAIADAVLLVSNTEKARANATPSQLEIEAAADVRINVVLGHRKGLRKLSEIRDKLLASVEQAVDEMPVLAEIIDMVRKEDARGVDKFNDAMRKAMGRSDLVDDLKKLAEVDDRVRKGEREAFNIDDGEDKGSSVDEILKKINASAD
ncbi:MAG: hypothetical protein Q7U48_13850 [Hydrogenophaga sp.]|nr:hypothetical protein [Hydrogenophaga sp.]